MFKKILVAIIVIVVGIQFIPVDRDNPPVSQDINPPEKISTILRNSCYDCHSNETSWPWYSYVAPVSFLVAGDVVDGRKHLNFSQWDRYDDKKKVKKLEAIVEVVEEGEMPLSKYTIIHPNAKLDNIKIKFLKDWVNIDNAEDNSLRYKKEDKRD
jgi:hypothetical protein